MTAATALALVAVLAAAPEERPAAALVVATPGSVDEAALHAARSSLETRFALVAEPELLRVLEEDAGDSFKDAQEALGRARQAFRRFDTGAARRALAEAREHAARLRPTGPTRALVVEIAVREAELERVESRPAEVQRHLGEALSVDSGVTLDRDLYAPPLVAQLEAARARREQAPKVAVRLDSVPPGARVLVDGVERCCTPLTVELRSGWQLLWFHHDGYRPGMLPLQLSSPGPVSLPLVPESRAESVRSLVAALRSASGEERARAAVALRDALGVEALAVLERAGEPPRVYERPRAPAPVAQVEEGPGFLARRWPVLAAAAAGVAFAAGAGAMGASAAEQARAADAQRFASDGTVQWEAAAGKARVSNVLWTGAALSGAAGVVLYFVY